MISVVIPVFNRENLIQRAIKSVLKQGVKDEELEVIVVDDGSTDNTKGAVEELNDPRIEYIFQENGGVSKARNTGILNSKGKYVALLDSDDIMRSWSLLYRSRFLDENPEFDGITGSMVELAVDGHPMFSSKPPKEDVLRSFDLKYKLSFAKDKKEFHDIFNLFVKVTNGAIPFICSSLMLKKESFERIGLFNTELKNSEDLEFFFRMTKECRIKYDFGRVDAFFQMQEQGLSKTLKRGESENHHQKALELMSNDANSSTQP